MAAIDFFGYLFVALGPSAAFYGVFITPKSFVVLLSIFRCGTGRRVAGSSSPAAASVGKRILAPAQTLNTHMFLLHAVHSYGLWSCCSRRRCSEVRSRQQHPWLSVQQSCCCMTPCQPSHHTTHHTTRFCTLAANRRHICRCSAGSCGYRGSRAVWSVARTPVSVWSSRRGEDGALPFCRHYPNTNQTHPCTPLPPALTPNTPKHSKLCQSLEAMSRRSGHVFSYSDHIHLALGWGTGHALCHALFFFAALLPLTTGDGSFYTDTCPSMSVFLVSALQCLGTSATLTAAMVVGLEGWRHRSVWHIAYAPVAHLASGLLVRAWWLGRGRVFLQGCGPRCTSPSTTTTHPHPPPPNSHRRSAPSVPAAARSQCPLC